MSFDVNVVRVRWMKMIIVVFIFVVMVVCFDGFDR